MNDQSPITLEKLDFDALYAEAEANEQYGQCPLRRCYGIGVRGRGKEATRE